MDEPSATNPDVLPSAEVRYDGGARSPSAAGFQFQFDYSLDTAGYFTPERRALLEQAAHIWEERLLDDFPDIPAGTPLAVKDVEDVDSGVRELALDYTIDDVVVFVGCTDDLDGTRESARTRTAALLTSARGSAFRAELDARWHGPDFSPWTSVVSFGCSTPFYWDDTPETVEDIPNDQQDFTSAALHELGHVLGVSTSDAYDSFVSADGIEFLGPRSLEVYGGPVPLERDGHVASRIIFEHKRVLMDDNLSPTSRVLPTRLDLALLEDIGYQVAPAFR